MHCIDDTASGKSLYGDRNKTAGSVQTLGGVHITQYAIYAVEQMGQDVSTPHPNLPQCVTASESNDREATLAKTATESAGGPYRGPARSNR